MGKLNNNKRPQLAFPFGENDKNYHTLSKLGKMTGYHPVHLRRLVSEGRVDAIKIEVDGSPGFWVSTFEAIKKYQATKDRRGRRIKDKSNHK